MNFKSILASVCLAAAALPALAANQSIAITTTPVLTSDNKFSSLSTPGDDVLSDGEDTLWFTGLAPGLYNVAIGIVGQNLAFNATTSELNGTTGFVLGPTEFSFFGVKATGNGVFTLHLFGEAFKGAIYSGNVTVTAVPEPEIYAMMLGGLLMLGEIARRKQRQK